MANNTYAESDLSSQSSLSGPPSDADMDTGKIAARNRTRRVVQDEDEGDDAEEELEPARSSRRTGRVRYDEGEIDDEEEEEGEEDEEEEDDDVDDGDEEHGQEDEDDELLEDGEDEDAEGSDVDELEDEDADDGPGGSPANQRSGRRITLRITPNKKGAAGIGRGSAHSKTATSRSKRARGPAEGQDDEENFEEFENEDLFASLPKTARQLAKEKADQGIDSPGSELLELPAEESKKARMTESELALKRSELARRRRNQTEKKLEDDKIETINRLLKKQVSRTGGRKKADDSDAEDEEAAEKAAKDTPGAEQHHKPSAQELKERPAPYFRYIQTIRDGVYVRSSLSLPIESVDFTTEATSGTSSSSTDSLPVGPYKRKWVEMFGDAEQAPKRPGGVASATQ